MNTKFLQLALNANLINYVDHETPRHYFIDGWADIEQVEDFYKLVIEECLSVIERDIQYNQMTLIASSSQYKIHNLASLKGVIGSIKKHFGVEE